MKRSITGLLAGIVLISACATPKKTESISMANSGKVWSSVWSQRSAEYRALCFQAYNIARLRLNEAIRNEGSKPYAVITDLDETVLDNSPEDAARAIKNQEFDPKLWAEWTTKGVADTVPGAPSFFKYAASKGVAVFYITNRSESEKEATMKNLSYYGMPNVDDAHYFSRTTTSSKESRRQTVLSTYNIILLCGDNLGDFDALYDNKPNEQRRTAATDRLKKEFGNKYIVIPNLAYGDWENALFDNQQGLTPMQKDSIIKAKIRLNK